jgi:hypothetical protein
MPRRLGTLIHSGSALGAAFGPESLRLSPYQGHSPKQMSLLRWGTATASQAAKPNSYIRSDF